MLFVDIVCTDGLGVRKIGTFNQVWHFGTEDTHSWRCVVAMKYGEEWGGWTSKLLQGTHVCCLGWGGTDFYNMYTSM